LVDETRYHLGTISMERVGMFAYTIDGGNITVTGKARIL
jgi:hypothetical protein